MLRDFRDIIDLPVETQSNELLGKVDGIVVEIETQTIYQYKVKPSGITHMFSKELLIHRDQVLSITKDKVIVKDGSYAVSQAQKALVQNKQSLQTETVVSSIKRE